MTKVLVLGLLLGSSFAFAGKETVKKDKEDRKPAADAWNQFSDGTRIERVSSQAGTSFVYQIKQPDGKTCYAIATAMGGDNAGNGASITCF